ncbi:MAG: DNA mismatch repair protein MutS [Bacteroidales bacterium]|nr:DNA mismatch repair protein MutS [Bacteroidales bacterium]
MAKSKEDTPMLKQYFSIKAQYPEAVLLYRVGDFYETYSDDALLVSKVLGIVLTKRSNGEKGSTPMAGFPHHAIEQYLHKLIRAGYKVAVCDQLEDPKLSTSKIVKRGVTEILTPGVAFGENMLEVKEHNYLAGLTFDNLSCGAAFLDVSTGTFQLAQGSVEYIQTLLGSLSPKELVVQRDILRSAREKFPDYYISGIDEWAFVEEAAREKLKKQFGVSSLKGFAIDNFPLGICSAGALIAYLEQTHHSGLKNICSISRIDEGKFVWMDRFTFRNLEIFQSNAGKDGASLVDVIDRCCTPMGARLLREYLAMPIIDIAELEARYDIVEYFTKDEEVLEELRTLLGDMGDLERTLARAATGRILPRETLQLSRSLSCFEPVRSKFSQSGVRPLDKMISSLRDCSALQNTIASTLCENPAAAIGKGEVIASGISAELDELRELSKGGKQYLEKLCEREIERTGISSLKISYNNVFGYYIEVRNTYRDQVPPEWVRKQTLVGAERYITQELKDYEEKILSAEEKIYALESRLYAELVAKVQKSIGDLQHNCAVISKLDILEGFARQALDRNYCRPVVDKSSVLDIKDGRHPVIETLMAPGEEYVPNDIFLDSKGERIIILTGPNMAGKSALLRQTALIVLMAQIGSFVPASAVKMGFFDKIFTRVGATDNISRGESTFMVEMLETSMIMHNLSQRSLVLLDEIGRGTSTYDGMSIARALVEYIHEKGKGTKTLFATHYHELNDMASTLRGVRNCHVSVKEDGNEVIFLRKLQPGGSEHSFGIHVARMAGMPREVIDSAERTLHELERKQKSLRDHAEDIQLSLFQLDDPTLSSIKEQLEEADLNSMTPLQAFDLLRKMKAELGVK